MLLAFGFGVLLVIVSGFWALWHHGAKKTKRFCCWPMVCQQLVWKLPCIYLLIVGWLIIVVGMFIYHNMLDCLRLREISFWHYCQRVWASPCLVLVNVSVCGKIKIVSFIF